MAAGKITWDGVGQKEYRRGVSQGVLYLWNATTSKWEGVPWNGLTNVTESPEGGDAEDFYADNTLYASIRGVEKLNGSIEAFTWPIEFESCIGHDEIATGIRIGQQNRVPFCFCYRTEIGNDQNPNAGYELHLIYNATSNAAEMSHDTDEDSPNLEPISYDFSCNPVPVTGKKPTSSLTISSLKVAEGKMTILEDALFGKNAVAADAEHNISASDATVPYMPLPDDVLLLIA